MRKAVATAPMTEKLKILTELYEKTKETNLMHTPEVQLHTQIIHELVVKLIDKTLREELKHC